jgi:glycosyltransferase involved in cell wall biosynthesis
MIRVAHLLTTLEIGGRERTAIDLARAGRALGIEPLLITHERASPRRATIDTAGVAHIALDSRAPDFPATLKAILSQHAIDLVHAHGHVTAIHAARIDLPRITTLHVALGNGWRWALPVARALRAMDAFVAVSDDLARRFAPLAGRRAVTIPTGVDLSRFTPAPVRPRASLTVGMLSRLHAVKRHRDAFAAVAALRARGIDVRLLVAGDGPIEADLRALAAADPRVSFVGPVEDSSAFLAQLDAFLLCSDHEGTPLALIEAMASGLPCIATAVGGVPALAEGGGVMLVPRRRPDAIADALAGLRNAGRRRNLARASVRRAQGFSFDRQASRYAEIYRELIVRRAMPATAKRRRAV